MLGRDYPNSEQLQSLQQNLIELEEQILLKELEMKS